MRLGVPAALLTCLLLGVTACSDDSSPDSEPSAQPSAATSSAAPAADGPEVDATTATFSVPADFEVGEPTKQGAVIATGPSGELVSLVEVDFPAGDLPLDRQAEIAVEGLGAKFTAEDPVEVDGVEMWHVSGKESQGNFADVYGAIRGGNAVRLTVRLSGEEYDAAERAALNESILASWTWAA